MSKDTIAPHGGQLNPRLDAAKVAALKNEAASLKAITLDERRVADLEMLAVGAMSPLDGFMGQADYDSVVQDMKLASGRVWSLPITLCTDSQTAETLTIGERVRLEDGAGKGLAVMTIQEKFSYNKRHEAALVFRTDEEAHPGVAALYAQGDVALGGPIEVFELPDSLPFPEYRLTPAETRAIFRDRGWKTVVGFQTRNPVHRAHEYIQKVAMEMVDGLLLHPLVGTTKGDDIPADVRMKCYHALLENYYPMPRVLLSVFPAAMRYGGPREAIFHAIARKNYGCTHFIVGRDHAGVGSYYGSYDAQKIFEEIDLTDLAITPLFFENSFWCRKNGCMATDKTSNSGPEDRVSLSGTAVREMLRRGEIPPVEFTRPEVAKVLIEFMKSKD